MSATRSKATMSKTPFDEAKHREIIRRASQHIYNLKGSKWQSLSTQLSYCGFIDLKDQLIYIDSFERIADKLSEIQINKLKASCVDLNIPLTYHGMMLYILGRWENYKKSNFHERSRYRGFSYQKGKGWRSGSCTLNVPIAAINAIRREDFATIKAIDSGLENSGYGDSEAKLVYANQMDGKTWIPLKEILVCLTKNCPEKLKRKILEQNAPSMAGDNFDLKLDEKDEAELTKIIKELGKYKVAVYKELWSVFDPKKKGEISRETIVLTLAQEKVVVDVVAKAAMSVALNLFPNARNFTWLTFLRAMNLEAQVKYRNLIDNLDIDGRLDETLKTYVERILTDELVANIV